MDQTQWVGIASIKGPYHWLRMVLLTAVTAGIQFVWGLEMAYGTPYLLSLGLSKSYMSLVWIAGPLSGLFMQPFVGILSDHCTSRFGRRRPFLVIGTAGVLIALFLLGWTKEIASVFTTKESSSYQVFTIVLAVISIYIMDFSVNAIMACSRSLVVDILPSSLIEEGSAWTSRMIGFGAVASFYMGFVDLVSIFPIAGDSQLKVFAFLSGMVLLFTTGLTCWAVTERVLLHKAGMPQSNRLNSILGLLSSLIKSIRTLPPNIQTICNIQFFAWIGWFPILFYSTTWIGGVFLRSRDQNEDQLSTDMLVNEAARQGSLGLLLNSLVSLAVSVVAPFIVAMPSNTKSISRSTKDYVRSGFGGRFSKLADVLDFVFPIRSLTLPLIWCISHFVFAFFMFLTLFMRHSLLGADMILALTGFSWAISMWAPLSLLGEFLHENERVQGHRENYELVEGHDWYPSNENENEQEIGVHMESHGDEVNENDDDLEEEEEDLTAIEAAEGLGPEGSSRISVHINMEMTSALTTTSSPEAGVVLGIQNVYVVLPQFLVTFLSSIIFWIMEPTQDLGEVKPGTEVDENDAIGLVMRLGGFSALVAGILTFRLLKRLKR